MSRNIARASRAATTFLAGNDFMISSTCFTTVAFASPLAVPEFGRFLLLLTTFLVAFVVPCCLDGALAGGCLLAWDAGLRLGDVDDFAGVLALRFGVSATVATTAADSTATLLMSTSPWSSSSSSSSATTTAANTSSSSSSSPSFSTFSSSTSISTSSATTTSSSSSSSSSSSISALTAVTALTSISSISSSPSSSSSVSISASMTSSSISVGIFCDKKCPVLI